MVNGLFIDQFKLILKISGEIISMPFIIILSIARPISKKQLNSTPETGLPGPMSVLPNPNQTNFGCCSLDNQ
jgi:hypothetical protein